ncbi:addiction module HigA family antidote [Subtercola boreus]|nr:addiction module HigA family antidote [Subtercola boreus]
MRTARHSRECPTAYLLCSERGRCRRCRTRRLRLTASGSSRFDEIVHGKRGMTADTAIRLARCFGTSEEFWMNLQSNYELRLERRALWEKIEAITPLTVA